jgi:Skp family chaperone for outer membrane proteins
MKRVLAFTLAAVIGAASAQPVFSQDAVFAQDGPAPTKIGFLDIRTAFKDYWKRENVEKSLRARTDALEGTMAKEKDRLEELGEELKTLNQSSPDFLKLRREIEMIRFSLKFDQEEEMRRIQREARRKEALLYKDIVRECQAFGEERGYATIMLSSPLPPSFENEVDLELVIATRNVLWHDDRLDVTADVLEFLNAGKPK